MKFGFARLLAALALLGSLDGLATAQTGGAVPNTSATAASTAPAADAGIEPLVLTGMLAAQNDARKRIGVPALKWSSDLASRADAAAKTAGKGSCSINMAERAAKAENGSYYWAAGMPRIAGSNVAQDISASYLVSRWREGSADYDVAKGLCRTKSSSCDSYSRMVAPKAKFVGCARNTCSNQAQVWICLYSEQAAH
ncbi:MAG: CAP domain-containing protein [Hyphomonadaceae bacterium]